MPGHPAPEIATAKGRRNAILRHHGADAPAFHDAERDLAAAKLADYIRTVVDAAPPLTPAQRDRLAGLLRPVGEVALASAKARADG